MINQTKAMKTHLGQLVLFMSSFEQYKDVFTKAWFYQPLTMI